jgi:hypothetical protein
MELLITFAAQWNQRRSQDFLSRGASINPGGANKFFAPQHFKSPPPLVDNFLLKNFPNNNITIAFVAIFPVSVIFPTLHHEDSDNIEPVEPALKIHW